MKVVRVLKYMLIGCGMLLSAAPVFSAALHEPEYDQVTDPSLPRVLIIGDSISMGYTPVVRALLTDRVNVHRPNANCGATFIGLRDLDKWLDGRKWDVIHFNHGVHDLRYCFGGDPYKMGSDDIGFPTAETGAPRTSLADYEKNLRELVGRLKTTGAKLIWGNTTPIEKYFRGYDPVLVPQYNAVAARVMKENGVCINDLNAVVTADQAALQAPDGVHCNTKGSLKLAEQVAAAIEQQLAR
jgi:acyl-CoA thioesterase-1